MPAALPARRRARAILYMACRTAGYAAPGPEPATLLQTGTAASGADRGRHTVAGNQAATARGQQLPRHGRDQRPTRAMKETAGHG